MNTETPAANFSTRATILGALLVMLFIALRLWRLTADCLWFDEIFSVHATRHSWTGLLAFVSADLIHPPLFYLLLKLWVALGGESLFWLRLFPALTACAALAPLWLLCRELQLKAAEINFSLLLVAVNGYLIHYAQMLRMYSLLAFFALCSLWLFVRFLKMNEAAGRESLALLPINLLLVYTHYYGWLLVGTELLYLLVWQRRKVWPFVKTQALIVICFVPWAVSVWRASAGSSGLSQNIGWTPRPGFFALARFFNLLNEPLLFREAATPGGRRVALWFIFYFALLAVPIALWIVRARRSKRASLESAPELRVLLMFAACPLVAAFLLSLVLPQSIWGGRHLIVVAIPYLLLAAVALRRLRPGWLGGALLSLFCVWTLIAGLSLSLQKEIRPVWCAWDEVAARASAAEPQAIDRVTIYAFEDLTAYHLWFALASRGEHRFNVELLKGFPDLLEDTSYFLPRAFSEVRLADASAVHGEHFYVAYRDTSFSPARQPLKTFLDRGYQLGAPLKVDAHGYTAFLVPIRRN